MRSSSHTEQLTHQRVTYHHRATDPTQNRNMYCLWLTTVFLVPSVVFSQDYLCPDPRLSTCQEKLVDGCKNDTTCQVPGERCCSNGCHGDTCRPVVPRTCPVGEALNTTDGPVTCSSSRPCPGGFYCQQGHLKQQGSCCRNHTLTGCRGKLCGRDELCYMKEVHCIKAPCPAIPTCFTHPCKGKVCHRTKCRLVKNFNGTLGSLPVTATCEGSPSPSGAGTQSATVVILTMVPLVGAFLASL